MRAGVAALTIVWLLLWPARASADSGISLRVSAGSEHAVGAPLALDLVVRNASSAACGLSSEADGSVRISAVTRDGVPVPAQFAQANYLDGFSGLLGRSLRQVPAGGEMHVRLDALTSVQPLPSGDALVSRYWTREPGHYSVALAYQVPQLAGATPCPGASPTATVTFTVAAIGHAATTRAGVPLWAVIAVIAVVGAVLCAGVILLRRGRGSGAAVLVVLASAVFVVQGGQRAGAELRSSDTALLQAANTCVGEIRAVGGEPARIVDELMRSKRTITLVRARDRRPDQDVPNVHTESSLDPNKIDMSTTWWSDAKGGTFHDGVAYDACAALFHEMVHAYSAAHNTQDNRSCSGGHRLSVEEARATIAENNYRQLKGGDLKPRTEHNPGETLPPSFEECVKNNDKPSRLLNWWRAPRPPACFGVPSSQCGRTNGDPHLSSFDGKAFDFQAVGEFVAARSSAHDFEMQTRQAPMYGSRVVSANTAVAVRVGADRLGWYYVDGAVSVHVNGKVTEPAQGDTPLPGGGILSRRPSWNPYGGDGYSVVWPDKSTMDVEPYAGLWFDVTIQPALSRRGTFDGLLGDFDGHPDNDGVSATDTWRIDDAGSLFDYASGQSTATFTDRSFPDGQDVITDAQRDAARLLCHHQGITDPVALAACVLDVSHTGQTGFALSSSVATEMSTPAPPATTSGTVRDGDTVSGQIAQKAGKVVYPLNVDDATIVQIEDITGEPPALRIEIAGPDGGQQAGFMVTRNNQWRVVPHGAYQLVVSRPDEAGGPYSFRIVTAKERRLATSLGSTVDGQLDVPGRVDLHALTVTEKTKIKLTGGSPCKGVAVAVVEDGPQPRAYSPADPCLDIPIADLEPGKHYVVVVWSTNANPADYRFTITKT